MKIGVTGIIIDMEDNILLGRRSNRVSSYKQCLECVPSGHLGEIDAKRRIIAEFWEETNLDDYESVKCIGGYYDEDFDVYDIIFEIRVKKLDEDKIKLSWEYDKPWIVNTKEFYHQTLAREGDLVPTLKYLTEVYSNTVICDICQKRVKKNICKESEIAFACEDCLKK